MIPPVAVDLAYIVSAILFVFGLKLLGSPASARRGNLFASSAMLLAIVVTLLEQDILDWRTVALGLILGSLIGAVLARSVQMTAMPQLVGIFNGLGGGASAVVAAAEFYRVTGAETIPVSDGATIALSTLIGTVTFSGSMIAFGKLQGVVTGSPVTFSLQKSFNLLLFLAIVGIAVYLGSGVHDERFYLGLLVLAFLLGVLLVIPIGGADMPVVISLLNSYSGLAASAAGFVLGNNILIISGALVGAAGLILTQLMCKAMNRSLANVAFGAFGGVDGAAAVDDGDKQVRSVDAEETAMLLSYSGSVVFVPGYGLAVAQAQHEVRKLMDLLEERGVTARFAIHPVAGRMPGHMNVLLAEADVPYDRLFDLDEINPDFERTDVVVVVGANDVVNPAARDPGSVIAGMPILNVDKARNIVILKRSLSPGFAGIDNELFYMDRSMMFFGDAKESLSGLVKEIRELG